MYFIVIFESLNYQSHLVTKYNFVSKYYYIIKGIMCFLSLYQLDINKNTILSIFLYIEEEFSCIKKQIRICHQMALAIQRLKKYHKVQFNESTEFIIMYVLTKMFTILIYKNNFCPYSGNRFISKEILNIFPIVINQALFNNIFMNLMYTTRDLPYLTLRFK